MRISLCNEVIAALPFERQCEFARQVGYDGLELAPMTVSAEPHLLPAAKRVELRRAAADAGIAITGLHYLLRAPEGLSITSADAAQRARTLDVMRALCELAADLGAGVLVHGSPDQRRLTAGAEDEGRKRAADCFAQVAPAAEAAGVAYCIEPLSRRQTDLHQHGRGSGGDRQAHRQPGHPNHDRLLVGGTHGSGADPGPDPAMAADRSGGPYPFQRSQSARAGRGRSRLRPDPGGAARGRLPRDGLD